MTSNTTSQAIAEAASRAMDERDHASKHLGIEIAEIKPGFARLTMTVKQTMVNGHDICHGGMIFTLADTAFAHACNSYNFNTVAAGCSIEYLAPAKLNDVLTANAQEQTQVGRTGIYDVVVTDQDQKTIAVFRGKSARIKGELVPGLTPQESKRSDRD
jgi:acyl-CoA thioesterase